MNFHDMDFGRSYLYFRTTETDHTPRAQVDAVCTLSSGGEARSFFLTCAWISEQMYLPDGFIHEPAAECNIIAAPRDQFLLLKRHASARHDVRSAFAFGQTMPTHDGKGGTVVELDVIPARYGEMQPLKTYAQFRHALLNRLPINGRTQFTEADGTEVTLEYPARTVNVAHDREAWQVDAGPLVLPTGEALKDGVTLPVAKLDLGYLVFNSHDYVESVIRRVVPSAEGGINFYDLRRSFACRNELFAATI